jgi:hypothetical protein
MSSRASIFEKPALDISGFGPKADQPPRPDPEQIDQIAGEKFRSREVTPPANAPSTVGQPPTKRPPMVYRTGRNVTFSAKTTQSTIDAFYEIARQKGWKAGETFEMAVAALQRDLKG